MAILAQILSFVLGKFVSLASIVIAIAVAAFVGLWLLSTDMAAWLFEQVLDLIIVILDSFNLSFDFLNVAQYIPALPADVVNLMGLLGVGQALGLIFGAIVIKVILQLIPFTRLGS